MVISLLMALSALNTRRTIRQYKEDPIPKEQLEAIIKATLNSPTACDCQEIDLYVCQDKAKLDKMTEVTLANIPEGFRKSFEARTEQLKVKNVFTCDAPCVVFLVKNERADPLFASIDTGIVSMSLLVAASEFGLSTMCLGCVLCCSKQIEEIIGLPEGKLAMAVAIGQAREDATVGPKEIRAKAVYLE